jgi:hypothetical protein
VERPGVLTLADRQLREPFRVEPTGLDRRVRLRLEVAVALEEVTGYLEVLVDGLARDQQLHDLARSLEDAVDPHVTQHLLGGNRLLAPGEQRVGGLVDAAAANISGSATPIDWCADSIVEIAACERRQARGRGCSTPATGPSRRTGRGTFIPSAPSCLRPSMTESGIFASRSIWSGSTCSSRNAVRLWRKRSPVSTAIGFL